MKFHTRHSQRLKDKIKDISEDDILKLSWNEPPLIFVMAILNILICNCNFIYQQYQDLSLDKVFTMSVEWLLVVTCGSSL